MVARRLLNGAILQTDTSKYQIMMCPFFYIAGWADLLFYRVLNSWIKMENFAKIPTPAAR